MTEAERRAAQAYLRVLRAVRAVVDDDPDRTAEAAHLLAAPVGEADRALEEAGLRGNEARLFGLVRQLQPGPLYPGPYEEAAV
ncbi:hypothetical protein [Streptomyces sp. GC420]|uniref:hypothetical protein n=1 Tax=Streptomyces sp. GC420 TaxID=2697568 RepID=UPI0014150C68|nr:hypothetical protein [Streptomyces sp. GC420]NBM15740.1 hypothetical protein [Streptomyces sp. GC420]